MPVSVVAPYDAVDFDTEIVLQSSDSVPKEYKIAKLAAKQSVLLSDLCASDETHEQVIFPLPNINGVTLYYVIDYLEYHVNNPSKPLERPLMDKLQNIVCDFDKEFVFRYLISDGVEKEHSLLIDVCMAANFLGVQPLLDLTCAAVASMIKGKTTEEIRELFNIENDFTPEEENRIKEENKWIDQ